MFVYLRYALNMWFNHSWDVRTHTHMYTRDNIENTKLQMGKNNIHLRDPANALSIQWIFGF